MASVSLDIFKRDTHGNPIWVGTLQGENDPRHHLSQLAAAFPGEYFAFDHQTCRIVASVGQLDSINGGPHEPTWGRV
jgi:hypothetical protein